MDLQAISEPAHEKCPECTKPCERVFSVPMAASVHGDGYRAETNRERRAESIARATGENAQLREASKVKTGLVDHSTHDCALLGCFGDEKSAKSSSTAPYLIGSREKT